MKKGMTPEVVEQMAEQIRGAGDDTNAAYTTVQGRVTDFDWTGEDRDRYVSDFDSSIGQLVQQVRQQAQDFADRAQRNAQEQREASA